MTFIILYLPRLDLLPVVVKSCKLDRALASPMANGFLVKRASSATSWVLAESVL